MITLLGLNFAANDPSPSASLQPSLELSVQCSTTSWSTATAVKCSPPPPLYDGTRRTAWKVGMVLEWAGLVGSLTGQFSYDGTGACAAVRRGTCSTMIACCCAQLRP